MLINLKKAVFMVAFVFMFIFGVFGNDIVYDDYGLSWHTDMEIAQQIASDDNKPIFVFAGRSTCGLCAGMKRTLIAASSNNKELLEQNYIAMYYDVDETQEHWRFFSGMASNFLPFTAVLPINAYDRYIWRNSGPLDEESLNTVLTDYQDAKADLSSLEYREFSWFNDFEEGMREAEESGKPVFLFAGTVSSGGCQSILKGPMQSIVAPNIKGLLINDYVMIYQDTDTQGDFWRYADTSSISLPFIAIIGNPRSSEAEFTHGGSITTEVLYSALIQCAHSK